MWANVATKLNILKDNNEITLSQLANIAKMSISHMSNFIAQRQQSLPLEAMLNICNHFGVTVDDFINAPIEGFSIEKLKDKKSVDSTRAEIDNIISDVYNNLNADEKVWFKVELQRFIKTLPKLI